MKSVPPIPPGPDVPRVLNVLIEIPKGSQNKYEYDHELHIVKLDRVLFSPLYYPGDYGFIPQTLAPDGDPLDALVLVTFPTYPGTLIEVRPLGMLKMVDGGKSDNKLLCVPVNDIRFAETLTIEDVQGPILNEIEHFFTVYKHLEGKVVEVSGWDGIEAAHAVIEKAVKAYQPS